MLVIGVDCATQANKTGMVLASWSGAALRFEDAAIGSKRNPCLKVLSWWIGRDPDLLLALDAPLGWPEPLGSALATHSAGKVISEDADDLFSRTTDRRIRERLGKRPFEVGANLIARTAHAALKMLEALRRATGHSIPLVWEGEDFSGVGAIEVYPAATRIAHGLAKSPRPLNGLKERMEGDLSSLGANPHVLDAAWCAVAGADFLAGLAEAPTPKDRDLSRREGWIWVRSGQPEEDGSRG